MQTPTEFQPSSANRGHNTVRVLVTGATGFIGAPLVQALLHKGHEVVPLTRRRDADVQGCRSFVWDVAEERRPVAPLPKVDAIVHAAQSRNYQSFPADGRDMFRVNVAGCWSLLDYAVEMGVTRFCLLSSGTVYEPYRGGLEEDAPVAPTSFLGATKLAAEELARPYQRYLELSALRLFFPFGPGQTRRLIPDIIGRVRSGRAVELSSDGEGLRIVPTYVDDIVEIIAAAITEGWTGTMNVAAPRAVSLRELAEVIGQLIGKRPTFEITNRDNICIVPALDRLAARFDMNRFTPLEAALGRVVAEPVRAN
jgi:nucleoside-diphosphate-sugar epimerase